MEIQQIIRADVLDIIFDGRNKEYGAYDLRKTYNRRLAKAMAAMASICLLLIGGYTLAGGSRSSKVVPIEVDTINLVNPVHEQPVTPPPSAPKPRPQAATIQSASIRIVPDQQVRPQDVPPPSDIPDGVKIGTATTDGALTGDIVEAPTGNGVAGGVVEPPKKPEDDESIIDVVEMEASYPGGLESWRRFLSRNFRVPEEAIAKEISGTVIVQFVVDKEGNVSDVKAISGPEELRAEAVSAVKKSGKWTPAIQNGRKVNSYKRQPFVVRLENE